MKRTHVIFGLFLLPLVAADVALVATGNLTPVTLVPTLAMFGVVMFLFWFFNYRGQRIGGDERTVKLARTALSYSWMFSIYVVILLSASDTLGLLHLSGQQYLVIIIMTMSFSFLLLHVLLGRKGDIE